MFVFGYGKADYWIWPIELLILYIYFDTDGILDELTVRDLSTNIEYVKLFKKHSYNVFNKKDVAKINVIYKYMEKLYLTNNFKEIYDKMMVYQLSQAFAFIRAPKIKELVESMMMRNPIKRPSINQALSVVKTLLGVNSISLKTLTIDVTSEKNNKYINEIVQAYKKRLNKKSPTKTPAKKTPPKKKSPKKTSAKKTSAKKTKKIYKSVSKVGQLKDCLKMKVKEIKNTKAYKNLPAGLNKSKMKKADLCKLINSHN